MPVIVLFFEENGLNQRQIMILQAIFSIAIVLFEIPSGYFSDIIGRKISIAIGAFLGFAGITVYAFAHGFWSLLLGELILGFGSSFISGSDSALIYDSLLDMGKRDDYVKFESRKISACNFSESFAAIIGGVLATISLRTPIYVMMLFNLIAFLVALTLVEPQRHKLDTSNGQFTNIVRIVKFALHQNRQIKWLIIYSAIMGASTLTMVWLIQPYLKMVGLPLVYFGVAWAALNFSVGVFTYLAHPVESHLGRRTTLVMLLALVVAAYWSLAATPVIWGALILFVFYFVRGINIPVLKDYINKLISSDKRATVLSVQALASRLTFSVIGPLVGWAKDIWSLPQALYLSGLIFLVLGVLSLVFLAKNRAL